MREIGSLSTEPAARRFTDYLLTRGIKARIEADAEQWSVWIFDEDQVDAAKQELAQYRQEPEAASYREAARAAADIRSAHQQAEQERQRQSRRVDTRAPWEQPLYRRLPVTFALLALSGLVAGLTMLGNRFEPLGPWLTIVEVRPVANGSYEFRNDRSLQEVRQGQVWRLVTPIFLHFGPMHLLGNMLTVYYMGQLVETRLRTWRYLAMILAIAVVSNWAQFYWNHPVFGGMSGVAFGLIGFAGWKTLFAPQEGLILSRQTLIWCAVWFLACFTGMLGPIANTAHTVGLVLGVACAWLQTRYLRATGRRW